MDSTGGSLLRTKRGLPRADLSGCIRGKGHTSTQVQKKQQRQQRVKTGGPLDHAIPPSDQNWRHFYAFFMLQHYESRDFYEDSTRITTPPSISPTGCPSYIRRRNHSRVTICNIFLIIMINNLAMFFINHILLGVSETTSI